MISFKTDPRVLTTLSPSERMSPPSFWLATRSGYPPTSSCLPSYHSSTGCYWVTQWEWCGPVTWPTLPTQDYNLPTQAQIVWNLVIHDLMVHKMILLGAQITLLLIHTKIHDSTTHAGATRVHILQQLFTLTVRKRW